MEYLLYQIIELLHKEMPELLTIDEDYGQLENLQSDEPDMYPITFPAVLIDAPDTDWSDLAAGSQKGLCTLRVRLILDCYDDTHAGSGTPEKILERHQFQQKLHHLLQKFRPAAIVPDASASGIAPTGLIRTRSKFYTWSHGIKVYEMLYSVSVTDIVRETVRAGAPRRVSVSAERL